MSKRTMRQFDEMCLTPVEDMAPEDIRALRLREHASQAVFARYLDVTTGLVSQWERGEKRPRGASAEAPDAGGEERSSELFAHVILRISVQSCSGQVISWRHVLS